MSFEKKEYENLFRIYLSAQQLLLNKDIIHMYHMSESIRLQTDFQMLLHNIVEYVDTHKLPDVLQASPDKIKESYDFLKNKNSVPLTEAK